MIEPLKFSWQPRHSPALIVAWDEDAGRLGIGVTDYLNRKLGCRKLVEIEPVEFFTLDGVAIEDNLIQFPESKFYACPENELVVFQSPPPAYEWYKFLNMILDTAEHYYHVRELHIISEMVSISAHTAPRELRVTFNSTELKKDLSQYDLVSELSYETPPGQRPTISSFLLWVAQRRNIPAVNLRVPIPFYLVAADDPKAQKRILEIFNQRFSLGIDFGDLDEEIERQIQLISEMRNNFPDIDESIKRLETKMRISAEDSQKLAQEVEKFLKEKGG